MTALAFTRNADPVCASTPALRELFASEYLFPSNDDLFTPESGPEDIADALIANVLDAAGLTDTGEADLDLDGAARRDAARDNDLKAAARAKESGRVHAEAKTACFRCPIREGCLSSAMQFGFEGMWGGTTKAERDATHERRKTVTQVLDVGSVLGTRVHLQDNMPPATPGKNDSSRRTPDDLIAYYSNRGMQTEEIAEILDVTPRTVTRARARARVHNNPEAASARSGRSSTRDGSRAPLDAATRVHRPAGPPRKTPARMHAERVGVQTAALYDTLSDGRQHTGAELLATASALFPAAAAHEEGIKAHKGSEPISHETARRRGARALAGNRLYIMRRDGYAEHDKIADTYVMNPAALSEWLAYRAQHPAPQTPLHNGVDQDGYPVPPTAAQLTAEADRLPSFGSI